MTATLNPSVGSHYGTTLNSEGYGGVYCAKLKDLGFANIGNDILNWIGPLWSTVYQDKGLLQTLGTGRGLAIAQAYLDLAEAIANDRNSVHVFNREMWQPIVIRLSGRGGGDSAIPCIGDAYGFNVGDNTMTTVGGKPSIPNAELYKIEAPDVVLTSARYLTNTIMQPGVVLEFGKHFTVKGDTLAISKMYDPFDSKMFNILELENADKEVVLWCCDAAIDDNNIADFVGYPLGLNNVQSSPYMKRIISSVWDMITLGASMSTLKTTITALLGLPVAKAGIVETVIHDTKNGVNIVITDNAVYRIPKTAGLRSDIDMGTVLKDGDTFDTALRLYPPVFNGDANKLNSVLNYAELLSDVPSLVLPPELFDVELEHGLAPGWADVPILCSGYTDKYTDNTDNPKLWFDVGGTPEDSSKFWEYVWSQDINEYGTLRSCLHDSIDGIVVPDGKTPCGYISPLGFMLSNLVGANTIIAVYDASGIATGVRQQITHDLFELITSTIPAGMRFIMLERRQTDDENYDTTECDEDVQQYAYTGRADTAKPGNPGRLTATYRDNVTTTWKAVCGV